MRRRIGEEVKIRQRRGKQVRLNRKDWRRGKRLETKDWRRGKGLETKD